MVSPKPAKSSS
ncbi:hypothetical protein Nmel_012797 [Mimus melanotis]